MNSANLFLTFCKRQLKGREQGDCETFPLCFFHSKKKMYTRMGWESFAPHTLCVHMYVLGYTFSGITASYVSVCIQGLHTKFRQTREKKIVTVQLGHIIIC